MDLRESVDVKRAKDSAFYTLLNEVVSYYLRVFQR